MSDIDRIAQQLIAAVVADPETAGGYVKAALEEYGQIVREECAKAADAQAIHARICIPRRGAAESAETAELIAAAIRNKGKIKP